jgi:type VI secretion system protein ImpH
VIEELIEKPESFSYFQALRLLYLANQKHFNSLIDLVRHGLLIKADTSLGFPASDLIEVKKNPKAPVHNDSHEDPRDPGWPLYSLKVTFMGLYGSSSPLPPFYAREVMEDSLALEDNSEKLFDLITLPSYLNHAEAYFYNLLPFRLMEENDHTCFDILQSLMGLGAVAGQTGKDNADLAFLNLFATQARHAQGLMTYLGFRFHLGDATLQQCVLRWVPISDEQRSRLGLRDHCTLGSGAVLGQRAKDVAGKFTITFSVSDQKLFHDLMPGGALRGELEKAVDRYLTSPLVYDLILVLAPGAAQGVTLGQGQWRSLGLSTFLAPAPDRQLTIVSTAGGQRGTRTFA